MGFFIRKKDDINTMQKDVDRMLKGINKQIKKEEKFKSKLNEEELILYDIENHYKYIGYSANDSKNAAKDIYLESKCECEIEQTAKYSKIGKEVFELAKSDKYLEECVQLALRNGVDEAEIEAWWSLSDIKRKVDLKLNEQSKLAAFKQYRNNGMTANDASNKVKKCFASYGYVENNGDKKRHIPPELKFKVDDFLHFMNSSEVMRFSFEVYLDEYNNFNELVRDKWLEKNNK